MGRISVSSPHVLRPFKELNAGKPYAAQIKPFNFLLTCHVKALGHPIGADPERFQLVAPFEADARKWTKMPWIDQYSDAQYHIATLGSHGSMSTARVKTYWDVLREYEAHPEAKCADAGGQVCGVRTVGLLTRRHVRIDSFAFIGKESNLLEEVEAGAVQAAGPAKIAAMRASGYDPTNTADAQRRRSASASTQRRAVVSWRDDGALSGVDFRRDILPKLQGVPVRVIAEAARASISHASKVRCGRVVPHKRHWRALFDLSGRSLVNLP